LGTTSYTNLSPADKTYLHTAACTLGMLAYNIDRAQRFDPSNLQNDSGGTMFELAANLYALMNGIVDEANGDFEVLPKQRLQTYGYNINGTYVQDYNPRDYDLVPPEAFLAKLREVYLNDSSVPDPLNKDELRLAELIINHFQIRRDRTYGFRSSPAANTWNYNPYITYAIGNDNGRELQLWSSACDPNIFTFQDLPPLRVSGRDGAVQTFTNFDTASEEVVRARLSMSRLCGTIIPPIGTRDLPGDTSFPPRKMQASLTAYTQNPNARLLMEHIPRTTVSGGGGGSREVPVDGIPESNSGNNGFSINPGGGGTRASELYFGDRVNIGGGQEILRQDSFMRASVAPKWPALYYLFPEFNHDHDGAILEGTLPNSDSDDVDHRQPDGALVERGGTQPMLAGFQPWAEPYITDSYIRTANTGVTYRVVDSISPAIPGSAPPTPQTTSTGDTIVGYQVDTTFNNTFDSARSQPVTFRYRTYSFPIEDRPVASIALQPRRLPPSVAATPAALNDNPQWELPVFRQDYSGSAQNVPVNRIMAPNGDSTRGRTVVIPFLDRVLFNGREWMPVRVMDIDIGMLRRTQPSNQVTGNTDDAPNDSWLPASGIVYAFREDAVREDAINRPATASRICEGGVNGGNVFCTDVRNASVSNQVDPPLQNQGVSVKAVDFVPDPERRPHGFRLRNGSQLTRSNNLADTRGLSFFTDNPIYIMGHYNLHQTGSNDSGTPPNDTNRTEEFTQRLPDDAPYTEAQFYTDRRTADRNFAEIGLDRWRPSEILADAVTILSNTFCDGSILDTFMTAGNGGTTVINTTTVSGNTVTESNSTLPNNLIYPYRQMLGDTGGANVYNNTNNVAGSALYGSGSGASGAVGCQNNGRTSFLNQNRPNSNLPTSTVGSGGSAVTLSWEWLRENPYDRFSPVKISRNGDGLVIPPTDVASGRSADERQRPMVPVGYSQLGTSYDYYNISTGSCRPLQVADNTRINSIIVSGIPPSRNGQSYGGLHNFPRLLEDWRPQECPYPSTPPASTKNLWLAGSFLQLNFSNYATAPFDAKAWEPAASLAGGEQNRHYDAPNRLWGYDVALQIMPAGPAAARFVTPGRDRSEFYNEPAANDPYIRNLCLAAPDSVIPDADCPS
jgi:hypothetical protein